MNFVISGLFQFISNLTVGMYYKVIFYEYVNMRDNIHII